MTTPIKLTPQRERELSVAAGVDPRTARKVLAGGRTTSTTHARVRDAAAKMGIVVPDQEPGIATGPEIAIQPRKPSVFAASRSSPIVILDQEPAPREEKAR